MSVDITITVRSSDGVELTRSYSGGSNNPRFYADYVLVRGDELLCQLACQLAKLAELEGGPLFDSLDASARLETYVKREV